jgi:hypothetical protein
MKVVASSGDVYGQAAVFVTKEGWIMSAILYG